MSPIDPERSLKLVGLSPDVEAAQVATMFGCRAWRARADTRDPTRRDPSSAAHATVMRSVANHAAFGVGLFVAAVALQAASA